MGNVSVRWLGSAATAGALLLGTVSSLGVASAAPNPGSCAAAAVAAGASTPADVIHPNIHDKVGDGSNANPNGVSPTGGGEIHGIGNVPGQSGNAPGVGNLSNVHGGIAACNPRA